MVPLNGAPTRLQQSEMAPEVSCIQQCRAGQGQIVPGVANSWVTLPWRSPLHHSCWCMVHPLAMPKLVAPIKRSLMDALSQVFDLPGPAAFPQGYSLECYRPQPDPATLPGRKGPTRPQDCVLRALEDTTIPIPSPDPEHPNQRDREHQQRRQRQRHGQHHARAHAAKFLEVDTQPQRRHRGDRQPGR